MKDRPPERTFAKSTFGRFAAVHGISTKAVPVDPGAARADAFVVEIRKGGRTEVRLVQFDRIFDFFPVVEDVLENIANEAAILRHFKEDPEGLARLLEMDPADPRFSASMAEVRERIASFAELLGEKAFREFEGIREVRGPLP